MRSTYYSLSGSRYECVRLVSGDYNDYNGDSKVQSFRRLRVQGTLTATQAALSSTTIYTDTYATVCGCVCTIATRQQVMFMLLFEPEEAAQVSRRALSS